MRRRLGIDVGKYDAAFILIHAIGGDCAGNDLAEQAVGRHGKGTQLVSSTLLSLKVLRMLPLCPRVVSGGEGGAAADRRMAEGPELHQGMGGWVLRRGVRPPAGTL